MAIKLKKVKLSDKWKNIAGQYIAQTVQYPIVETDALAQQVSLNTGFTKTMVKTILDNCLEAAGTFLSIGHPVRLGQIGVVRVNCDSTPSADPEDVVAELKPGFRCSSELKALVKQMDKSYVSTSSETVDDTGDDTVNTGDGSGSGTIPKEAGDTDIEG